MAGLPWENQWGLISDRTRQQVPKGEHSSENVLCQTASRCRQIYKPSKVDLPCIFLEDDNVLRDEEELRKKIELCSWLSGEC